MASGPPAAGMILGLLTFIFTQRLLQGSGLPPGRQASPDARLGARDWVEIAAIALGVAGLVFAALQSWGYLGCFWSPAWLTNSCLAVAYKGAVLVGILVLFIYATEPPKSASQDAAAHEPFTTVDWQRIAVIVIISLFSIVFWMGFEQSGGTLNLFADEKTDRTIFGYNIPASVFQAINPFFIITAGPGVRSPVDCPGAPAVSRSRRWRNKGLGLSLLGLGFVVMYFADKEASSGRVSPLWLIAVYFIFTVAELFVSPIGLSLVNKLAHPRVASLMMACWFLCTAAANYLAGIMEHTLEPYHLNLWAFLGDHGPGTRLAACWP